MGRRSRGWVPSPATALLLSVAFALVGNMATNTVDPPDSWRWWPWAVWAAVVLLVAGSVWVQRLQVRPPDVVPDDRIVADLAARIERDWAAEAVRREVTRPAPLLVSWSSTGRPAASRAAVLGHSPDVDWQKGRPTFRSGDNPKESTSGSSPPTGGYRGGS